MTTSEIGFKNTGIRERRCEGGYFERGSVRVALRKLLAVQAKLFHARQERGAVYAHPGSSSIRTPDSTFALAQATHDLLTLILFVFSSGVLQTSIVRFSDIHCAKGFFHNSGNLVLS